MFFLENVDVSGSHVTMHVGVTSLSGYLSFYTLHTGGVSPRLKNGINGVESLLPLSLPVRFPRKFQEVFNNFQKSG